MQTAAVRIFVFQTVRSRSDLHDERGWLDGWLWTNTFLYEKNCTHADFWVCCGTRTAYPLLTFVISQRFIAIVLFHFWFLTISWQSYFWPARRYDVRSLFRFSIFRRLSFGGWLSSEDRVTVLSGCWILNFIQCLCLFSSFLVLCNMYDIGWSVRFFLSNCFFFLIGSNQ